MNYRIIFCFFSLFFILSCKQLSPNKSNNIDIILEDRYKNSGFALVYNSDLVGIKALESRSLNIYHKSLKKRSKVKILNPVNGKYLIAEVKSNKVKFSNFYNSILTSRIANDLELDLSKPYIEITLISENSIFVAKKSKMFDEERKVAQKAPVAGIQINDLNKKKKKKR